MSVLECCMVSRKRQGVLESLKNWDVMVLVETWVDEAGWDEVKGRLPRGYVWEVQFAKRRKTRGRAIGGMVLGMRKSLRREGRDEGGKRGDNCGNGQAGRGSVESYRSVY